jgi:hypothetical protein
MLVAISVVALLAVLAYSFQPLHLREQLIARPAALVNPKPQQNMYSKPLPPEKWLATREAGAMEVSKTKVNVPGHWQYFRNVRGSGASVVTLATSTGTLCVATTSTGSKAKVQERR